MPLEETIRVKLSSEQAEYMSLTPVVAREMPVCELLEMMLGVTGKDAARVRELLLRGTLVSGGSRLRWEGIDVDRESIQALLDTFPDPEPARQFSSGLCVRAILKGPAGPIDIPREVGARRRMFRDRTFWDVLMDLAAAQVLTYIEYSYKERADCYLAQLSAAASLTLRQNAGALRYSSLESRLRTAAVESIEFYVTRP